MIRRDIDGNIVLIGFGIFKEIGARVGRSPHNNSSATTKDSGPYVSPEQALGQIQFNSDLYALGTICILALTGRSLAQLSALRASQSQEKWYDTKQANSSLIKILDKMVHVDSTKRYQSARDVLADLANLEIEKKGKEPVENEATPNASLPSPIPSNFKVPPQELELLETSLQSEILSPIPSSSMRRMRWMVVGGIMAAITIVAIVALFARVPQKVSSYYAISRGMNREKQGDFTEAANYYTRAINGQPDSGEAYYRRGLVYQRMGNREAALEDFTEAIQLGYELGDAYYQRGNLRFLVGDRQGAQADYTEAIKRNPNLAEAYVNRGSTKADLGDDKGAVEDYTKAIQMDPTLPGAYLNRCLSWSNIGDQKRAVADCTKAIDLRPTHTFAYQNRGLARRRQGDIDGAIDDYNIAINLDPEDADPYYNRGLARRDLQDNRGAIADFTAAIERNPDHALAYYDRGLAYRELGNIERAIADFQQSAQLCLDVGRQGCYNDAQYQLNQLSTLPAADKL